MSDRADDLRNALVKGGDRGLLSLASILAGSQPAPPPPVKGFWFKDQTIHIDDYEFDGCRFDKCNLVTTSATFKFRRCFISPDCRLYFRGAALKTVRLLMHTLQLHKRIEVREDESGVFATVNDDGTFSLE